MKTDPRHLPRLLARAATSGSSSLAAGLARVVARLPDSVLVRTVQAASRAADLVDAPADARLALDDLLGLVRDDAQGREALRKILLETRPAELRALVEGLVRASLDPPPVACCRLAPRTLGRARTARRPTVVVVGQDPDAPFLRRALARVTDLDLRDAPPGPPDRGCLPTWDALEVADPAWAAPDVLERLLEGGTALSIHYRYAPDPAALDRLEAASRRTGTPLRVLYPLAGWAPVRRVAQLLDEGAVGEVSCVRLQVLAGGRGGAVDLAPPAGDGWLRHPALDHALLFTLLGGPVGRLSAYLDAPRPDAGGRGVVSASFRAPGRLGVLELVSVPDLDIPSDHLPLDLFVEAAGTDGFVWLRRGPGRRTHAPAVELRAGTTHRTWGEWGGLPEDMDTAWDTAAVELRDMLRGRPVPTIDAASLRSGLALADRIAEAGRIRESLVL